MFGHNAGVRCHFRGPRPKDRFCVARRSDRCRWHDRDLRLARHFAIPPCGPVRQDRGLLRPAPHARAAQILLRQGRGIHTRAGPFGQHNHPRLSRSDGLGLYHNFGLRLWLGRRLAHHLGLLRLGRRGLRHAARLGFDGRFRGSARGTCHFRWCGLFLCHRCWRFRHLWCQRRTETADHLAVAGHAGHPGHIPINACTDKHTAIAVYILLAFIGGRRELRWHLITDLRLSRQ